MLMINVLNKIMLLLHPFIAMVCKNRKVRRGGERDRISLLYYVIGTGGIFVVFKVLSQALSLPQLNVHT
ncbi:hypothetical protein Leryth_019744 [Lithospermum erythrorhizon]|nr:hypothetical protein Leryth_019744 [Lithospermum erythrorhizon]